MKQLKMGKKVQYINFQNKENISIISYLEQNGLIISIEKDIKLAERDLNFKKFDACIISSSYFNEECIDIIKKVKAKGRLKSLPIIVILKTSPDSSRLQILEEGAHDCLVGNVNPREVYLKLINLIELSRVLNLNQSNNENISTGDTNLSKFVDKVIESIDLNISNENLDLPLLSDELKLSKSAIQKKIKKISGKSVSVFIREYRLNKAQTMIESGLYSISEVVEKVGFGGPSYFSKCFKEYFGFTPSKRNIES